VLSQNDVRFSAAKFTYFPELKKRESEKASKEKNVVVIILLLCSSRRFERRTEVIDISYFFMWAHTFPSCPCCEKHIHK
jgi:hypothetical protein